MNSNINILQHSCPRILSECSNQRMQHNIRRCPTICKTIHIENWWTVASINTNSLNNCQVAVKYRVLSISPSKKHWQPADLYLYWFIFVFPLVHDRQSRGHFAAITWLCFRQRAVISHLVFKFLWLNPVLKPSCRVITGKPISCELASDY